MPAISERGARYAQILGIIIPVRTSLKGDESLAEEFLTKLLRNRELDSS
jgi:hypothetical protein